MSRVVVLLALVGGSACSRSARTCDVAVLAAERVDGVDTTDCGHVVAEGEDQPGLQEAHDCVEGALDASSSFLVVWTFHGFEGDVSSAYVGTVEGEQLTLEHYQRAPDGTGNDATSRRDCADLTPMTTCDASLLRSFLCFECQDPSAPDVICPLDS